MIAARSVASALAGGSSVVAVRASKATAPSAGSAVPATIVARTLGACARASATSGASLASQTTAAASLSAST